jgi:hypothetical protein
LAKKSEPKHKYDVRMIRHFVDHLLWELRTSIHERTHSTVNPELVEQLAKYQKHYGTYLLPIVLVKNSISPEAVAKIKERLNEYATDLSHLEACSRILNIALECAESRDNRSKTFEQWMFGDIGPAAEKG